MIFLVAFGGPYKIYGVKWKLVCKLGIVDNNFVVIFPAFIYILLYITQVCEAVVL